MHREPEYSWDIEWVDAGGTPLVQQQRLSRDAAEQQAARWLTELAGSQVLFYRRHDTVTVLIEAWPTE